MHCYTLFSYANPVQLDTRNQHILHKSYLVKGCNFHIIGTSYFVALHKTHTCTLALAAVQSYFRIVTTAVYQLRTNMSLLDEPIVTLILTLLQH